MQTLNFGDRLTLGNVEAALAQHTAASADRGIEIDLRTLQFAGVFPSMLLLAWVRQTLDPTRKGHKAAPHVELRFSDTILPQVKRTLFNHGIASAFQSAGATVPIVPHSELRDGISLTPITGVDALRELLHDLKTDFYRKCDIPAGAYAVIEEAFQVILFELAENALLHGTPERKQPRSTVESIAPSTYQGTLGEFPTLVAALSHGSGSMTTRGIVHQYDVTTPILEIVVSDDGPGIPSKLHLPSDWRLPAFWNLSGRRKANRLSKEESSVLYAFEFASSSDTSARAQRIVKLIGESSPILPEEIPTGLYCVLNVVQRFGGQVVVRSPQTIVSFDFGNDSARPEVRLRDDLLQTPLAPLRGTHFLLRLPLSGTRNTSTSLTPVVSKSVQFAVLDVFATARTEEQPSGDEGVVIAHSLEQISQHLLEVGAKPGVSVIPPPPVALTSRGREVLFAGLRSLLQGRREIIALADYVHPAASTFVIPNPPDNDDSRPHITVGDPFSNQWFVYDRAVPLSSSELRGDLRTFSSERRAELLTSYRAWLAAQIRSELERPPVRLTDGPFRFPRRYYTETYFDVGALLDNADKRLQIAHWFVASLILDRSNEMPEFIAVSPLHMKEVGQLIVETLSRATGIDVDLVCIPGDTQAPLAALRLLPFSGKRGALVTDVVCTGRSMDRLMEGAAPFIRFEWAAVLVDGRIERENGKPFRASHSDSPLVLSTLHGEPIETVAYLPPHRHEGSKGYFDVNPESHRLEFHAVPDGPAVKRSEFFEMISATKSITVGHFEHDRRHLTHFVNFRLFFQEQQTQITDWIVSAAEEWRETLPTDRSERMSRTASALYVFNQREELSFLARTAKVQQAFAARRPVLRDDLHALCASVAAEGFLDRVIVIPALVTGYTARTLLRAASAAGAKSVLLLVVASRAPSEEWTFLEALSRYNQTDLRLARYVDFPIGAYKRHSMNCPICTVKFRLERLASDVEQSLGTTSRLGRFAREKAQSMDVRPAPYDEAKFGPLAANISDEILLHMLYEAAAEDGRAAADLRSRLEQQVSLDRFLGLLTRLQFDKSFSEPELRFRLGDGYAALSRRAEAIILDEKPPFPLGRVLGALAMLRPALLGTHAASLHARFKSSPRDEKELGLAISMLAFEPLQLAAGMSNGEASLEFAESVNFARRKQAASRDPKNTGFDAVLGLWKVLVRHSDYAKQLAGLINAIDDAREWAEIREMLSTLRETWFEQVNPNIDQAVTSGFWVDLTRQSPTHQKGIVTELATTMATIGRFKDLVDGGRELRYETKQALTTAIRQAGALAEFIGSHFASVLDARICGLNPVVIIDLTGREIEVVRDIDRSVDRVFLNPEAFDDVTSELVFVNWSKHVVKTLAPELILRIKNDHPFVAVELEDNISEPFGDGISGDIAKAHAICRRYGGWLEISPHDPSGRKRLVLRFVKLPAGFTPRLA